MPNIIHTTVSQSQQYMCQNSGRKPHVLENKTKKNTLKGQELQYWFPLTLAFAFSVNDVSENMWTLGSDKSKLRLLTRESL